MTAYEVTYVDSSPVMTPVQPRYHPVVRANYPGAYALPIPTSGHRLSGPRSPTIMMLAGAAEDAEMQTALMQRAMKETALKNAAVQVGIGVTLACIPIVGWLGLALQAVYAAATSVYGHKIKKKIKREMDGYVERVRVYVAQGEARVKAAESAAYNDEYPVAKQIADSGIPLGDDSPIATDAATGTVKLAAEEGMVIDPVEAPIEMVPMSSVDGLGNVWLGGESDIRMMDCGPVDGLGDLGGMFKKAEQRLNKAIAKPILKAAKRTHIAIMKLPVIKKVTPVAGRIIAEVHIRPVWIAGKGLFRVAGFVAKATGNRRQAAKWRDREKQWDRRSKYQMQKMANAMADPVEFGKTMREGWRTTTGEQSLRVTRDKLNQLESQARSMIDAETSRQLAKIATPEYRAELRLQIARVIRDPALAAGDANMLAMAERAQHDRINEAAAGLVNPVEEAKAAQGGGILSVLTPVAGLAAFFALR